MGEFPLPEENKKTMPVQHITRMVIDLWLFLDFIYRKYEEIYPPEISEFTYITDDTYTKEQVLKMEHLMLRVLEFNMCAPTPLVFFSKFVSDANANESTIQLGLVRKRLLLMVKAAHVSWVG